MTRLLCWLRRHPPRVPYYPAWSSMYLWVACSCGRWAYFDVGTRDERRARIV